MAQWRLCPPPKWWCAGNYAGTYAGTYAGNYVKHMCHGTTPTVVL